MSIGKRSFSRLPRGKDDNISSLFDASDEICEFGCPLDDLVSLDIYRTSCFKSFHHIYSVALLFLIRIAAVLYYGFFTFPPPKGKTTETADNGDVEPEIVPPSGVLRFIDPDI